MSSPLRPQDACLYDDEQAAAVVAKDIERRYSEEFTA